MTNRQTAQHSAAQALVESFNHAHDLVQLRIETVVGLSDQEIAHHAARQPGWYTAANLFGVIRLRDPTHVEAITTGQRLGAHPFVGARKRHGATTLWRLDSEQRLGAD
jgi:hypothetical protein